MRLQLFKRNNFEITSNPGILFKKELPISMLSLYKIKLNDNPSLIPVNLIETTTFEQAPIDIERFENGVPKFTYTNNKTFYDSIEGYKEYILKDRIDSVLRSRGIFHMINGVKYVVKNGSIVGFGLSDDSLKPYKRIRKRQIESRFGKASKVLEYFEEVDGTLFRTEYYFEDRQIEISFSDWNKEIDIITIGQFPYRAS